MVDPHNPYKSPETSGILLTQAPDAYEVALKTLRDFRAQMLALGVCWIVIGLAAVFLGFWIGTFSQLAFQIMTTVMAGIGLGWIIVGSFTCAKQMGAVYVGLALSYLAIIINAINLNSCGVIFIVLAILQAHCVIGWAKKLTALGIPLTAKPHELQAPH